MLVVWLVVWRAVWHAVWLVVSFVVGFELDTIESIVSIGSIALADKKIFVSIRSLPLGFDLKNDSTGITASLADSTTQRAPLIELKKRIVPVSLLIQQYSLGSLANQACQRLHKPA